ncbi:MAG: hypothetical protein HamCj_15980 [Candidatus Hamiltonella defensa (Ceratovacuna japonica)]
MIQYFSREDFSNIGLPEVGAVILFTAINGREMPGIVYEVMAESITVDFNHPLAGHSVNFDIEVLKIDPQDGKKNENIVG